MRRMLRILTFLLFSYVVFKSITRSQPAPPRWLRWRSQRTFGISKPQLGMKHSLRNFKRIEVHMEPKPFVKETNILPPEKTEYRSEETGVPSDAEESPS